MIRLQDGGSKPGAFYGWIRRLAQDRSGAMAVVVAAALFGLLGFVALGVDVSLWYSNKRTMQTAADAAAIAGAHELMRTGWTEASVTAAAQADAGAHGFTPASGANLDVAIVDGRRVQTALTITGETHFSSLFLGSAPILTARAAAGIPDSPPPCLTVMDASGARALNLQGTPDLVAPNCLVQVNSTSPDALYGAGNASITAARICIAGGVERAPQTNVAIETGCDALPDPLADWEPPTAPAGCNSPTATPLPNLRYCNGTMNVQNNYNFPAGIYFLHDVMLNLGSATGTNVAFLLSGTSRINVGNNATVHLVAPTSGPMAGIVFAHTRDAPEGTLHDFSGGGGMSYEGAIYLPKHDIGYRGNSSTANVPPFTTYIVRRLGMEGTTTLSLDNNYAASGVPAVGQQNTGVRLVE